jgi:hypothetical protein
MRREEATFPKKNKSLLLLFFRKEDLSFFFLTRLQSFDLKGVVGLVG